MLRITAIRLTYRGEIPEGMEETVDRVLAVYAEKCPAYQSVKGCIDVSWTSELSERESD